MADSSRDIKKNKMRNVNGQGRLLSSQYSAKFQSRSRKGSKNLNSDNAYFVEYNFCTVSLERK